MDREGPRSWALREGSPAGERSKGRKEEKVFGHPKAGEAERASRAAEAYHRVEVARQNSGGVGGSTRTPWEGHGGELWRNVMKGEGAALGPGGKHPVEARVDAPIQQRCGVVIPGDEGEEERRQIALEGVDQFRGPGLRAVDPVPEHNELLRFRLSGETGNPTQIVAVRPLGNRHPLGPEDGGLSQMYIRQDEDAFSGPKKSPLRKQLQRLPTPDEGDSLSGHGRPPLPNFGPFAPPGRPTARWRLGPERAPPRAGKRAG